MNKYISYFSERLKKGGSYLRYASPDDIPVFTEDADLGTVQIGNNYSNAISYIGGTGSSIVTLESGYELPPKFTLIGNTLSVINAENFGTYTFKLRVTDSEGEYSTKTFTINVTFPPLDFRLANLTYTSNGNTVNCQLRVIEPVRITNVVGRTLALAAGEKFQLETNQVSVVWEGVDCDIISSSGLITIPYDIHSGCFGGFNCIVKGTLISDECDLEGRIGSIIYLNVKVNPYFPSRSLCGVPHLKWKREVVDFRVLVTEMEGGCDETHIRNKVPIYRWTIDFAGLPYEVDDCLSNHPYRAGCDNRFTGAKTLDDFWNAVGGEYGYFNLLDEETGDTWFNCRFEKEMSKDHVNKLTNNSRSVSIKWSPCCASAPLGAGCVVHYGFSPATNQVIDEGDPVVDDGDIVLETED